jgi:hypothetical protein
LDVRGDGGYVVVAPSVHPSGKAYEWRDLNDEIAAPCAWLISLITETARPADVVIEAKLPTPPATTARQVRAHVREKLTTRQLIGVLNRFKAAPKGKRNDGLFWSACRLFDKGFAVSDVTDVLLSIATTKGLTEREAVNTINSAFKTGRRQT